MNIKKNITSIFIVPTLLFPKNALKSNGFINGYIKDDDKENYYDDNNVVYLLFKPENLDKFREFLDEEYERTKAIVEDYDYEDGYVVIVYQLDDKYENDFNLIKKGKYSKTSTSFQSLFPKTLEIIQNGLIRQEISLQYRIFNKSEDLIIFWQEKLGVDLKKVIGEDFEVWDGWDEEKEILKIDKIKNYVQ